MTDPPTPGLPREPILDTAPRSWGELLDSERALLEALDEFVCRCIAGADGIPDSPAASRRRPPRLDRVRYGRVAMLDGLRGTGKTTLLLTALDLWSRARTDAQCPADDALPSRFAETGARIACLDLLDFDPQPRGLPVYAWLAQAFEPLVDALDDGCAPLDGDLDPDEPDLVTLWHRLVDSAAIGWQTEARWPLPSSDARVDAGQRTERWMHLAHQWRAFIDALIAKDPQSRLVVVPVDDVDMQPAGALDLLQAMRVFYHPRVLFLMTGHRPQLERGVRREIARRMQPTAPAALDGDPEVRDLARALVGKTIPKAHCFDVRAVSWLDALDFANGTLRSRLGTRGRRWTPEALPELAEPSFSMRSVVQLVAGGLRAEALLLALVEHALPTGRVRPLALPPGLIGFEPVEPGHLVAYATSHGGGERGPMIAHHTGLGWQAAGDRLGGLDGLSALQSVPQALIALAEEGLVPSAGASLGGVLGGVVKSVFPWQSTRIDFPWPMMPARHPSAPRRILRRFREIFASPAVGTDLHLGPGPHQALVAWLAVHIEEALGDNISLVPPTPRNLQALLGYATEHMHLLGARFRRWFGDQLPILAAPEYGLSGDVQVALLEACEHYRTPLKKKGGMMPLFSPKQNPWSAARQEHLERHGYCPDGSIDFPTLMNEIKSRYPDVPWFSHYRRTALPEPESEPWLEADIGDEELVQRLAAASVGKRTLADFLEVHLQQADNETDSVDQWANECLQTLLQLWPGWRESLDPEYLTSRASAAVWVKRIWSTLVAACAETGMASHEIAADLDTWLTLSSDRLDFKWTGPAVRCAPVLDKVEAHQWIVDDLSAELLTLTGWTVSGVHLDEIEPTGRNALGSWAMVAQSILHELGRPEPRLAFDLPPFFRPAELLHCPPFEQWVDVRNLHLWWRQQVQLLAEGPTLSVAPGAVRAVLVQRFVERVAGLVSRRQVGHRFPVPVRPAYPLEADLMVTRGSDLLSGLQELPDESPIRSWAYALELRPLVEPVYADAFDRGRQP